MTDRPHLAWPLRVAPDGALAVVEQDSLADVHTCVNVLLRTELGSRPLAPATGVPDPTFGDGVDAGDLERRLTADDNEPRAIVTVTAQPVGAHGRQGVRVRVDVASA